MTNQQFIAGITAFLEKGIPAKIWAVVSPNEEGSYLIQGGPASYRRLSCGILIRRGRNISFLPYESIIALSCESEVRR